jgi:hypothetical protein
MGLSNYAFDTFVSQGLSEITQLNAQKVGPDFPEQESWIVTFVLNRIFVNSIPEDRAALAFALLRQAEAAVDDYDLGCAELSALVEGKKNISRYFRCVRRFENAIGATYRAFDFGRRALGKDLFAKSDATPLQRLNELYNIGRHYDPLKLPAGQLHAVWLSNEGIHCSGARLTFAELRDLVAKVARIADRVSKGEVKGRDV